MAKPSWISLSKSSGTGGGQVNVTASANDSSMYSRQGSITVKTTSGLTKTVSVTQNGGGKAWEFVLTLNLVSGTSKLELYQSQPTRTLLASYSNNSAITGSWNSFVNDLVEYCGGTLSDVKSKAYLYISGRVDVVGNGKNTSWDLILSDSTGEACLTFNNSPEDDSIILDMSLNLEDFQYNPKRWGFNTDNSLFWESTEGRGWNPIAGFKFYSDENTVSVKRWKSPGSKSALYVNENTNKITGFNSYVPATYRDVDGFFDYVVPDYFLGAGSVGNVGINDMLFYINAQDPVGSYDVAVDIYTQYLEKIYTVYGDRSGQTLTVVEV